MSRIHFGRNDESEAAFFVFTKRDAGAGSSGVCRGESSGDLYQGGTVLPAPGPSLHSRLRYRYQHIQHQVNLFSTGILKRNNN